MNRRSILGFGAAAVAAPKTAGAALARMAQQVLPGGYNPPTSQPSYWRTGVQLAEHGGRGLLELISVAEKAALAMHEERLADVRAALDRRRFHRQFLHSMSPAARRAYDRADQQELAEAEGAVYGFMEKLRRTYCPDDYKEKCDVAYGGGRGGSMSSAQRSR